MLHRLLLCLAFILSAGTVVAADRELHVVGIYQGFEQSAGKFHGPKARVILSRPDVEVILVLSSYAAVRWEVELGRNTLQPTVVVAQRVGEARQSEVWIDGVPLPEPTRMTLPLTYKPEGEDFRKLVQLVPERFGVARMSSFSGGYSAQEIAFDVSQVVKDTRYDLDYLQQQVQPALVPESLRPLVTPEAIPAMPELRLTGEGFAMRTADGTERLILLPLDMPGISWPMGAVRDAATGTLYGVTLGGDGYLYAYTEADDAWRVDRSMEGLDAQALFLDAAGRRLIMPLGLGEPGRIAVIELEGAETGPLKVLQVDDPLPGYADLYDPGNGPAPDLLPVGIDGDRILLIARSDLQIGRRSAAVGADITWRAYLIDLSDRSVNLVGYGDAARAE